MEQECGARIYLLPTSDFCQDLFTFALSIIFYRENMDRTIITVVGKDTVGIIAKVCTWLADNNVNILDITQTIVQGYFNMMMIVDMEKMEKPFEQAVNELDEVGRQMGVQIKCQREEIFDKMHRI